MRRMIFISVFLIVVSAYADKNNPISDLLGRTYHISVKDDYLFASSTAGITVYRLIQNTPVQISYLVVENSGASSLIEKDYLYLFAGNTGVYKVDIKDPQKPVLNENARLSGSAINGDIYENKLFVSLGSGGFAQLNKKDLKVVRYFETPSYCSFVKVVGDSLFVSTEQDGLFVYKLKNMKPSQNIPLSRKVRDILTDKNLVYLANDTSGLVILKKEGEKYSLYSSYDTPDTARGVALYKEHVFVADGNTGVVLLSHEGNKNLKHIKNYNTGYSANKVIVAGDNLIISNDAIGVMVVKITDLLK